LLNHPCLDERLCHTLTFTMTAADFCDKNKFFIVWDVIASIGLTLIVYVLRIRVDKPYIRNLNHMTSWNDISKYKYN